MIHNFSETNSLFGRFLAEIRDVDIQKDRMRFRRNLQRIAEIMAYELSKSLRYEEKTVVTPLGDAQMMLSDDKIVLATILRAGLPMHQGLLNYFDHAESAFVSAYRKHTSDEDFDIHVEYCASPDLDKKVLVISDPMLATGNSMAMVYSALKKYGKPKSIHLVIGIATDEAINFIRKKFPDNVKIWVGAIDDELTAQSYIVPGLGDAGDLAFGDKV
ncbi:MAG: uracil phosphoribosyltransferase [Brumimicrobium sp.]|nr:uracil phosphoribosyltransferase [Brumimicrobium sp.]